MPPVGARVLALLAILVGGACGGLIGWAVVDVQCTGDCGTASAFGGLTGAVVAALGVAVVAVLALRAMGEWRTVQHGQAADRPYEPRAEDSTHPRLTYRPYDQRPELGPGDDHPNQPNRPNLR